MKRLASLFLALIMLSGTISGAYAAEVIFEEKASDDAVQELYDQLGYQISHEDKMPLLSPLLRNISGENTLALSERKNWANATTMALELTYNQEVATIIETADAIIFEFVPPDEKTISLQTAEKTYESEEEMGALDWQIEAIEYVKPESAKASSTLQTRFVYYWAWSDGKFKIDETPSAGTQFNRAAAVSVTVAGYFANSLQGLVLSALQFTAAEFISMYDATRPIKATTYVNYYYYNKGVEVYVNGKWVLGCLVGSRRGFSIYDAGVKSDSGQFIFTQVQNIGRPATNPTNYDSIEKKLNFDNNTWMINSAIEYYTVFDTPFPGNVFASAGNKV